MTGRLRLVKFVAYIMILHSIHIYDWPMKILNDIEKWFRNMFSRLPTENPNLHLFIFVEVCSILKCNNVDPSTIRIRLVPFSLRDRACEWVQSLLENSIIIWGKLKVVFLARYFPSIKMTQIRSEIYKFRKEEGESLFYALECFKDLLRLYPFHGL